MKAKSILIAFSLLTTLTACADNKALRPQPSPQQLASDGGSHSVTAVDVSSRCRELSKRVPKPAPTTDGVVLLYRYDAALALANVRLGATDECMARLAADYASGLKLGP